MRGTPDKIEILAPYDLGGTDASGRALPYSTLPLADGGHELTVKVVTGNGYEEVISTAFTVTNTVR